LPRKPYDGHLHGTIVSEIDKQIGVSLKSIFCDAGYKGHNAPQEHRFKIYSAGQKRKMIDATKREMRRGAAIESLIARAKSGHRVNRHFLAGQAGYALNAMLTATGYNFRRLLVAGAFVVHNLAQPSSQQSITLPQSPHTPQSSRTISSCANLGHDFGARLPLISGSDSQRP
jgi:hypothetical protein